MTTEEPADPIMKAKRIIFNQRHKQAVSGGYWVLCPPGNSLCPNLSTISGQMWIQVWKHPRHIDHSNNIQGWLRPHMENHSFSGVDTSCYQNHTETVILKQHRGGSSRKNVAFGANIVGWLVKGVSDCKMEKYIGGKKLDDSEVTMYTCNVNVHFTRFSYLQL